jgi:hypothetical protein
MSDGYETCINECEGVIKILPKSNDLEAIVTHMQCLDSYYVTPRPIRTYSRYKTT